MAELRAKELVEAVNAIVDALYGEDRPITLGNSKIFREKIERSDSEEGKNSAVSLDDTLDLRKENIILETLLDIVMHRSVEQALATFFGKGKGAS